MVKRYTMDNSIMVGRISYDRTPVQQSDIWNDPAHAGRHVRICRITDFQDREIVNARIYGTLDECDEAAEVWVNGLLRANPGRFLKWTVQEIEYDSVIRRIKEERAERLEARRMELTDNSGN